MPKDTVGGLRINLTSVKDHFKYVFLKGDEGRQQPCLGRKGSCPPGGLVWRRTGVRAAGGSASLHGCFPGSGRRCSSTGLDVLVTFRGGLSCQKEGKD